MMPGGKKSKKQKNQAGTSALGWNTHKQARKKGEKKKESEMTEAADRLRATK